MHIQPVGSRRDLKEFIKLPWKIYEGYPFWVPPLLMDRRKLVDRRKNPFYQHSDAEFFLARRSSRGEVVGRIGAILNHNHNKEHKENLGFFGFFESIDEQEVASGLFETAKGWLRSRGLTAMRGPANPSVNDEYGLLVDGFDKPPVVLMTYNPPYYPRLVEGAGLVKVKDLYAYELLKDALTERLSGVAERVRQREGLTFRSLDMKNFKADVAVIKQLYNSAWQYNWGAVPMTEQEFDALAKDLKPVVDPNLVIIAEYNGKPVGFALSLPDLNQALKFNKKGYLLPGLVRLFLHKKDITGIRVVVLGVVREHLKTGAASVLFYETARRGMDLGYIHGEAGWVLEDNTMMTRSAEFLNARRYKTYRLYETTL